MGRLGTGLASLLLALAYLGISAAPALAEEEQAAQPAVLDAGHSRLSSEAGLGADDVRGGPGARSVLERAWFDNGPSPSVRASHVSRRSVEFGASMEAGARALIASASSENDLELSELAVRLAPGLPIAHMSLARAQFAQGEYIEGAKEAARGIASIPLHLEASIWLAGSLLLMSATVLIASSLVFVVVLGISACSVAAHDLGDLLSREIPSFARAAMLATVVLSPLVLGEGVMGLVLALFAIGFLYGGRGHRASLALAAALIVIGLYPGIRLAGAVLSALDADPVASASLAVVRGIETPHQVALLAKMEARGDLLASRILALRARLRGESAEAMERYTRLMQYQVVDAGVLTTLGNMSFQLGDTGKAIELYERAAAIENSATLMFNLSQAYAMEFRMEEFEHAMERAQTMDPKVVAELSKRGDTSFVADLPFPIDPIRDRMIEAADGSAFSPVLGRLLAPGRLGKRWSVTAGAFFVTALLATLLAGQFQHASRCERCGNRICARCDDSMWSSELCDSCHHLFHRPQGSDPDLRMARLEALRVREIRVDKLRDVVSMIVPGASGLLAKRPGLCFFGILLFVWVVVLFVWRNGIVPDPLAVGGAGPLAFILAGCAMTILYVMVVISGLVIRRRM